LIVCVLIETRKEEALKKDTFAYHLSKEPPTLHKYHEGRAFNIITKEVFDKDKVDQFQKKIENIDQRLPIATVKYTYEKELKDRDAHQEALNDERSLNNKSTIYCKRNKAGATDYNILSGDTKKMPVDTTPVPVWKYIENETKKVEATSTRVGNVVNTDKGLKLKLR